MDKKRYRCIVFYCLQYEQSGHGIDSTCHRSRGGMDGLEKPIQDDESNTDPKSGESTRERATI